MKEEKKMKITKKPEEKKSMRSKTRYPALDPKLNLKSRVEEIEDLASYADQLSESEKEWLNAFASEEICASFKHRGPKLNDENDAAVRSRIYNRNNERNRCIITQEKTQGTLNYLYDLDLDKEAELIEEDEFD